MKVCINPPSLFDSRQFGFSQITVAKPGKIVFISEQVAWDEKMQIQGPGDLEKQAERSILNLQHAIELAGGTLQNIVMLRIYIVNYRQEVRSSTVS